MAGAVTLPHVGTVAVYFIVERVINGDLVVAMVVDCVSQELKPSAVSCTIIAPRMPP